MTKTYDYFQAWAAQVVQAVKAAPTEKQARDVVEGVLMAMHRAGHAEGCSKVMAFASDQAAIASSMEQDCYGEFAEETSKWA